MCDECDARDDDLGDCEHFDDVQRVVVGQVLPRPGPAGALDVDEHVLRVHPAVAVASGGGRDRKEDRLLMDDAHLETSFRSLRDRLTSCPLSALLCLLCSLRRAYHTVVRVHMQ